jgi:hypothetical protein
MQSHASLSQSKAPAEDDNSARGVAPTCAQKTKDHFQENKFLIERLQRIESRLVRGFSELGVRVTDDEDWFVVDHSSKTISLKSSGKSIASIEIAMRAAGCEVGSMYDLLIAGDRTGTLLMRPAR